MIPSSTPASNRVDKRRLGDDATRQATPAASVRVLVKIVLLLEPRRAYAARARPMLVTWSSPMRGRRRGPAQDLSALAGRSGRSVVSSGGCRVER